MIPTNANPRALLGVVLAATAFALYSSVDLIFKLVAEGHPVSQLLTINGIFALIPIILMALTTGGPTRLATGRLRFHMMRSMFGTVSSFSAVFAYSRIPLVDFYAILFSGPLLVTALSVWVLKEKIDWQRWLAIAIGFCGILVIVNPFAHGEADGSTGSILIGRALALLSVTCYACSMLIVRRMRATESNLSFSFYGYIGTISIAWLLWKAQGGAPVDIGELIKLGISGVMAGVGSICLMTAYMRSPVALVAPFQYTQLIWGAIFGYLFFSHVPDMRLIQGAVIVVISGLFIIFHELRLSRNA